MKTQTLSNHMSASESSTDTLNFSTWPSTVLNLLIQKQHLGNVTFFEPEFEPRINRDLLNCGRNLTIEDLCTPCGVSCNEGTCDSWKCAIACADKDFGDRVVDENSNKTKSTKSIYFRRSDQVDIPAPVSTSGKALPLCQLRSGYKTLFYNSLQALKLT